MLSDDAQSFFVYHLIRIRDRFTNAERNASEKRNATSLRLEKERKRSHSTTLERERRSHSTTLKKKKNRIRRRSKKEKNDRIRRRCRRRLEDATNDSKFESLIRLRANSTSTTTTTAYLINVAKHKKRILYKSFFKLHLLSSKL
jgi:biopolymer transport protein ExbB/TolQ